MSKNYYELTDFECGFLAELAVLLQYHVAKEAVLENLLTYIAITRLGRSKVKDGFKMKFDVELDKKRLTITEVRNK